MPPKKGVLQGTTIVLSGTFPGHNQSELKAQIKQCGGDVAGKVTDATTHVVASEKDWNAKKSKVQEAIDAGPHIQIVNVDWLSKSFEAKKAIDSSLYLWSASAASSQPVPSQSKKRSRAKTDDDENPASIAAPSPSAEPPSKKLKDGQKARSKNLNVPIDEGCNIFPQQRVLIDSDNVIWDANLNQTNAGNNNNKFYRIQLVEDAAGAYQTWTRWGRVGEHGQGAALGQGDFASAKASFEKKFKDKSGLKWDDRLEEPKAGKYTYIERNYEEDSEDERQAISRRNSRDSGDGNPVRKIAECTLSSPVQALLKLIFNQTFLAASMADMNYDAQKMPLGKLSRRTLEQGFTALKRLADLLVNPAIAQSEHNMDYGQAMQELSNRYYTVIPHNFGRNRPPVINDEQRLRKEIDLLESLSDMSIADEIMKGPQDGEGDIVHPLDRQYLGLGMEEMVQLDHVSSEYKQLEDYLIKTHGHTHQYLKFKVEEIFRIERRGERERFDASRFSTLGKTGSDKRLLWHGSRCTNLAGILSQGLRIAPPEAPVSGYMFGKGVYLADISSKSANYCCSQMSDDTGLLLLCEAELGQPMLELRDSDYNAGDRVAEMGACSTWGQGINVPSGWKDAGSVHESLKGIKMPDVKSPIKQAKATEQRYLQYNEYICYDVSQICLRYLFRVKMTY